MTSMTDVERRTDEGEVTLLVPTLAPVTTKIDVQVEAEVVASPTRRRS